MGARKRRGREMCGRRSLSAGTGAHCPFVCETLHSRSILEFIVFRFQGPRFYITESIIKFF